MNRTARQNSETGRALTSGQTRRRAVLRALRHRVLALAYQTPGGDVRVRAADGPTSAPSQHCEMGAGDDA